MYNILRHFNGFFVDWVGGETVWELFTLWLWPQWTTKRHDDPHNHSIAARDCASSTRFSVVSHGGKLSDRWAGLLSILLGSLRWYRDTRSVGKTVRERKNREPCSVINSRIGLGEIFVADKFGDKLVRFWIIQIRAVVQRATPKWRRESYLYCGESSRWGFRWFSVGQIVAVQLEYWGSFV